MTSLTEIRHIFFVECEEQLEQLTEGLDRIEAMGADSPVDFETVNTMFRAVHSIKGGAASFALDAISRFAHAFETALDEIRSGRLDIGRDQLRGLYAAADFLAHLVALGAVGQEPSANHLDAHIDALVAMSSPATMQSASTDAAPEAQAPDDLSPTFDGFQPITINFGLDAPGSREGGFLIHFRPTAALYANGHEPLQLFRELAGLGTLSVEAVFADPPSLLAGQPGLSWRLTFKGCALEQDIQEIFEFAEPFADIRIEAQGSDDPKVEPVISNTAPTVLPGDAAPQPGRVNVLPVPPAKAIPAASPAKSAPKPTVRVDMNLVDDLINTVGELVITQSVMSQSIAEVGLTAQSHLCTTLEEFRVLTRHIQEGIMAIRAQSLKPLFQRMGRIVRETAQIAGKEVRFVTQGDETEVDRTVIERLVDPLTHILRNAIDHGLEPPDARDAAGKSATGTVTLTAAHRSGRVLIEVRDDGIGIDHDKVLASAIRKGLVSEQATLSPAEIDRLLFTPGFSTASSVTNLSGRGVGMDVVNNEIRRLGGRVSIASTHGEGTVISISLPLTLAVMDGMIVDVAGQKLVVPISAIVETIRPEPAQLHRIGRSTTMVTVRDTVIPIRDLGQDFGYCDNPALARGGVLILVEDDQGRQHALAVDSIDDQRQVVIKSLAKNYGAVPLVAAATILGDGQIALIVDLDEMTRSGPAPIPNGQTVEGRRA